MGLSGSLRCYSTLNSIFHWVFLPYLILLYEPECDLTINSKYVANSTYCIIFLSLWSVTPVKEKKKERKKFHLIHGDVMEKNASSEWNIHCTNKNNCVLLIVIVYRKHYFRTMCTFEIGVWETEYLLPYCEIQWPISGKQDWTEHYHSLVTLLIKWQGTTKSHN